MIRPFTALCVLLAGASGLYLYTEKHRTTVLDQQISRIAADTQHIRERTANLRAEWTILNQPDRLQSLAGRFLPHLHPLAPTQFVQMASLADRLPALDSAPVRSAPLQAAPSQAAVALAAASIPLEAAPAGSPAEAPATRAAVPVAASAAHRNRPLVAPFQVMVRSLVAAPSEEAGEVEAAEPRRPAPHRHLQPQPSMRVAALAVGPVALAPRNPMPRPPVATAALIRPRQPSSGATRQAAYRVRPPHGLMQTVAAHAPEMADAGEPRLRPAGDHSALGFSHELLSAPVPVQDGN